MPALVTYGGQRVRRARAVLADGRFRVFVQKGSGSLAHVEKIVDVGFSEGHLRRERTSNIAHVVGDDGVRYDLKTGAGCGCGLNKLKTFNVETV